MNIAVLTGAGISRESGLQTFRDGDGLWNGWSIEEVCTPQALAGNPARVLEFYNHRRREAAQAEPNEAHLALARLEARHKVLIVTQNIDDLHEQAGSSEIIHIHGEVFKARSMVDFDVVVEVRGEIHLGDLAPDGAQLRPHVCFFGETPYRWDEALAAVEGCDLLAVIGTSLSVYPAAGLVHMARRKQVVLIDPNPPSVPSLIEVVAAPATIGVPRWADAL